MARSKHEKLAGKVDGKRSGENTGSAADFIPSNPTLATLRKAALDCRGCDLWKFATQTVFGEGPKAARVVLIGEQPGDAEDRAGHPFVGPTGKLLDRALEEAGIERSDVYVTNAVKHFKWTRDSSERRRIHKRPSATEVNACHPWLEDELRLLAPEVTICLGATAAKSLLGSGFSVLRDRGRPIESEWAGTVFATVHPSSVLRAPPGQREAARRDFVSDLEKVAISLKKGRARKRATSRGP